MDHVFTDTVEISKRIPSALKTSLWMSSKSFLQSALMMIPIGLILNIQLIRGNTAEWLRKGATVGVEWAKIGAFFVAGESLCEKLRAKNDRLNAYLGSGLSSAILRAHVCELMPLCMMTR